MKHLLLALVLGLMASNAYATQARLIALGMDELDDEGSYYIKDSRNIFLNAAYVNDFADRVIIEWGGAGRALGAHTSVEQDDQPKGQGGFLKKQGDFVYGLYYGNESNTSSFLRIAGTGNAAALAAAATGTAGVSGGGLLPSSDNQIDLFFGSDLGNLQWGLNVVYTDSEDEAAKTEDTGSAVRLGLKAGDAWDFHVNLSTSNKAERSGAVDLTGVTWTGSQTIKDEFKGKFGIHVGGSYNMNKWGRVFGYVKTFSWEQTDGYDYTGQTALPAPTGALAGQEVGKEGTSDGKFTTIELGWGKAEEVTSTSTLFYSVRAKKVDVNLELAQEVEVNNFTVPVTLGYEAQANSWLTLRGSITHNLYGKKDNKNFMYANPVARQLVGGVYGAEGKGTIANSTTVNAGATLGFGNLSIDGMIGTSDAGSKTDGNLRLDKLMSTVAMTYLF